MTSHQIAVATFAFLYVAVVSLGFGILRGQKKRGEQRKQIKWDNHVSSALNVTNRKK